MSDAPDHDVQSLLLHGEDAEAIRRRCEAVLTDWCGEDRSTNLVACEGSLLTPEQVDDVLSTPALFGTHRVLWIRNGRSLENRLRTRIIAALEAGLENSRLLIVYPDGRPPPKTVRRATERIEAFTLPKPWDREAWLIERARAEHGLVLEPEAAARLLAATGPDSAELARELEVLALGAEGPVGTAEVAAHLGEEAGTASPWDLIGAVARREGPKAEALLERLLSTGAMSGPGLLVLLGRHFLALARAASDPKATLKGPPWQQKRIRQQARRWTVGEIDRLLCSLAEADVLIKQGASVHATLYRALTAVPTPTTHPMP